MFRPKELTLRGPRPRPLNAHPPPTERHLTSRMAVTHSGPLGVPGLLLKAGCCSSPTAESFDLRSVARHLVASRRGRSRPGLVA